MPYPPIDRPERIAEVFALAWNRRDPDGIAGLFDEDAEFVNVTGLWWHDRAAIRKAHAYGLETIFPDSTLQVVEMRVKGLGADVAVVHARMHLVGQSGVGSVSAPGDRRTIFTFVVHRKGEAWSCAAAQNTDVVMGAETNVRDQSGRLRGASYQPS
jgi:uncharacterized protein (TIGR02246 family)